VIYDINTAHGLSDEGQPITFGDHSRDFAEPSSPDRKRLRSRAGASRGVALPNPMFIRIQRAIAGVLHMSGAGESIDQALDRAGKSGTGVILTGADFAHFGLGENLEVIMGQVAVR
jgi:hypothetical protein